MGRATNLLKRLICGNKHIRDGRREKHIKSGRASAGAAEAQPPSMACVERSNGRVSAESGRRDHAPELRRPPVSLLERFHKVVFRLIMFSAISKSPSRASRPSQAGASPFSTARPCRHEDSYRREAVEECIKYMKRSAAGGCSGDIAYVARRSSSSHDTVDDVDSFVVLPLSPVSAESLVVGDDGRRSVNESVEIGGRGEGDSRIRERRADTCEENVTNEEEDAEPINDPRWDGIRSRYKGFVDRGRPRFERPEVRDWSKQENWGRNVWKEAKESSVPKMVGQGVYGVGPVLAALTVERREFYALYVQEGFDLSGNNNKKKDKKGVKKVLKLAEKLGLKLIEASKHDLNMVVDNRPHQGLVLDASPLELVNTRGLEPVSLEGQKAPVWVALDEVTDPQNLGAIVRSAYFFGVEGVVLCAKNSAPLSGVVSKASAGSLELIELRSCKNMMQFLSSSIENGWRVLGGSVSSKASPLSEVDNGVPTILVLGSEGSGLRPLVERSCTDLVRIPGNICMDGSAEENEFEDEEIEHSGKGQELKSFLAVESLNVSVAAGVLLYHLVGKKSSLEANKANADL